MRPSPRLRSGEMAFSSSAVRMTDPQDQGHAQPCPNGARPARCLSSTGEHRRRADKLGQDREPGLPCCGLPADVEDAKDHHQQDGRSADKINATRRRLGCPCQALPRATSPEGALDRGGLMRRHAARAPDPMRRLGPRQPTVAPPCDAARSTSKLGAHEVTYRSPSDMATILGGACPIDDRPMVPCFRSRTATVAGDDRAFMPISGFSALDGEAGRTVESRHRLRPVVGSRRHVGIYPRRCWSGSRGPLSPR